MKNIVLSGRFGRFVGSLSLFSLLLAPPTLWSQKLPAQLEPVAAEAVPFIGTFYSLTLNQPPLPYLPFSGLPVYALPDGSMVYDDRSIDYQLVLAEAAVFAATEASFGPEMMSLDGPPSPGGGSGGGGGEGGGTNPPPYSVPGLKLTIPAITNGVVFTSVFESDTNSAYDLFEQFALVPGATWTRIAGAEIGETNFAVAMVPPNVATAAFYRAADTTDSDFDGLPDAVETLQLGLNPLSADSDGDGIADGAEIAGNGLPHAVNYKALTRAVIFASRANAYEGGQAGEWTILLPSPAPAGGALMTLHLGGYTDLGYDYLLTVNGVLVTNEVVVPAGLQQVLIQVQVVDNAVQETRSRQVQASLIAAGSFPVDSELAEVNLIDNDLPRISVIALDARAAEAAGVATNTGAFLFRREGSIEGAIGFYIARSGSAASGVDYILSFTNSGGGFVLTPDNPLLIENGISSQVVVLTPLSDASYEGAETATLTILPDALAGYGTIDTNAASATVTISDCTEPPVISFEGTDLIATEYNLKSAVITLRRVGCALGPMQVPLAISGTAAANADYRLVTNGVVMTNAILSFAAGAGTVVFHVAPLSDAMEERVETVVLTLKGSLAYTIGSSNSVTARLDDSQPARYELVAIKRAAVFHSTPFISSPAIYELNRLGRSDSPALVHFTIGNLGGGPVTKSGDVDSGDNFVFAPYASRAQLRVLPGAVNMTNYFLGLVVPSLGVTSHPIYLRPPWEFVGFGVAVTNAIEGVASHAQLQLARLVAGPALTLPMTLSGSANNASQTPADHNLATNFSLTIPAGQLSVQTNIIAVADSIAEGWEGIAITPDITQIAPCLDPHPPYFAFVGDNMANPGLLPGGDADGDGLSDRWEVDHNLNPLDAADAQLDPDGDGLTNFEEAQTNTDPQDPDTNNNNQPDYADLNRPQPASDYLAIRLRTLDTGKVNNGANCAACHTTRLKAGDHHLYAPMHGQPAEQIFYYRKGSNYPVYLQEISRQMVPTTNVGNTPLTTAKYNATLLPETDALPAAFVVSDPQNKLGTNQPWTNFPADPTLAVAQLIVPKIEVTWEDVPNGGLLDPNPGPGGGFRFYPDQQTPTDATDRRKLFVRVKTTPPVPGLSIQLKSIDVDDPSPLENDPRLIIDSNDLLGFETGNDNRGIPQAGQLQNTVVTLDVLGEAVTFFTVSLQPGDNYRIAAVLDGPGATNHLNALQVSSELFEMYVAPNDARRPVS